MCPTAHCHNFAHVPQLEHEFARLLVEHRLVSAHINVTTTEQGSVEIPRLVLGIYDRSVIVTAITDQESEHASVIHLRAIEGLLERQNHYLR